MDSPPATSLHHNFAGHLGMDGAEIAVRSGLGEGIGELLIGVERLRLEVLFIFHDGVRDVIVVGPANGSAGRNRDGRGRKAKVVDFDLDGAGFAGLAGGWVLGVDEKLGHQYNCGDEYKVEFHVTSLFRKDLGPMEECVNGCPRYPARCYSYVGPGLTTNVAATRLLLTLVDFFLVAQAQTVENQPATSH